MWEHEIDPDNIPTTPFCNYRLYSQDGAPIAGYYSLDNGEFQREGGSHSTPTLNRVQLREEIAAFEGTGFAPVTLRALTGPLEEVTYTEDQIRAAFEIIRDDWEFPQGWLGSALLAIYKLYAVQEKDSIVEAILARMFEREPEPYTCATIKKYGERYQVTYEDTEELARSELRDLIGAEIDFLLPYIDLPRFGADMCGERPDNYFEHGGEIHYFREEV